MSESLLFGAEIKSLRHDKERYEAELSANKSQIRLLNRDIESLKHKLKNLANERDELFKDLEAKTSLLLESEPARALETIERLTGELAAAGRKIAELESDLATVVDGDDTGVLGVMLQRKRGINDQT